MKLCPYLLMYWTSGSQKLAILNSGVYVHLVIPSTDVSAYNAWNLLILRLKFVTNYYFVPGFMSSLKNEKA